MICIPIAIENSATFTKWKCARCGFTDTDKHGHFPDKIYRICDIQQRGIGDIIGLALAKVGITKQRWAKWMGKSIGEQKTGCSSCHTREQSINHLGWKWQHSVNRIGWWFRHRYTWLKEKLRHCPNRDS